MALVAGVSGTVLERSVTNGADDAEQYASGAFRDSTSSDLELAYEDVNQVSPQTVGVRFRDIAIPPEAPIISAYVQFQVDETRGGTDPVNLVIQGHLSPNPGDFVTLPDIEGRPRTAAGTLWTVANWTATNARGADQQTSDIAAIIQELVNQPGWMAGNPIVLIFRDNPASPSVGLRCAEAYEGSVSGAPMLHVEFLAGTAGNPVPADGTAVAHASAELTWAPGDYARLHHVYFGTDSADVEAGIHGADKGLTLRNGFPVSGLAAGTTYYWRVDEVNDAHPDSPWEGPIWTFHTLPANATNPTPASGAVDLRTDISLSWSPGMNMVYQNIYLGTSYAAVLNSATPVDYTLGTTWQPPNLQGGKTYYWRIDTMDTCGVAHKGDVWSFTTMPEIVITDPDLIGWWTFDEVGPSALDWSGHNNTGLFVGNPQRVAGYDANALYLDGDDFLQIDAVADDITTNDITLTCWVATTTATCAVYACNTSSNGNVFRMQLDAGRVCVWDGADEGFSTQTVNDGLWHMLAYVRSGSTGSIYIDGVLAATHTADFTLGATNKWSLGQEWDASSASDFLTGAVDDVRFYNKPLTLQQIRKVIAIDPDAAWNPNPVSGAVLAADDLTRLTWSPGDRAVMHDVYFGADPQAVADATSGGSGVYLGRRSPNNVDPGQLILGQTYYWRIDEINSDLSITRGRIWSFTILDHILVEDFESYGNLDTIGAPGSRVWYTWADGFGYTIPSPGSAGNGTCSIVDISTYIVQQGSQTLVIDYDNTGAFRNIWNTPLSAHHAAVDAMTANLPGGRNWTRNGAKALSLQVRGYSQSVGGFTVGPPGTYTVTAAGADIWDLRYPWEDANDPYHDEFHFVYVAMPPGAHTITAQVLSLVNTNAWAKAGVMMRDTLSGGSRHAFVCISPGNGAAFQWRQEIGGVSTNVNTGAGGPAAPQWVRLSRDVEGLCSAYYSPDGVTWTRIGDVSVLNVENPMYVGLAVTSHSTGNPTTAVFSNVTINGAARTDWLSQDVGILSNRREPLWVEISDGVRQSRVHHPTGDPVVSDTFAQWHVALSSFTNVNLANVTRLSIGIGTPGPAVGGAGRIYVDNIRLYPPRFVPEMLTQQPADYDFDGIVDYEDLRLMVDDWLMTDYTANPLVAWYKLDDNALDSSGNGFHGIPTNNPLWSAGKYATAVDCNGSNQFIQIDANATNMGILGRAPRTIAAWVSVRTYNSGGLYEIGGSGNGEEFALRVRSTAGQWRAEYGGTFYQDFSRYTQSQWTHVAQTYDGGISRIYLDGVLVSTAAFRLNTTDASRLRLCRRESNYFNGLIDDLRLYNKALTPAEITSIMAGGAGSVSTYHPVASPMNLTNPEPPGARAVDFADFAVLGADWMDRQLWP